MDNKLQESHIKMTATNNSPVTKKFYESPEKHALGQSQQHPHPQVLAKPFDWDEYLKQIPAEIAPKEAFMQARHKLFNKFQINMKLEARDPKKNDASAWSLATVVALEGQQRIRLRFDGSDSMSDIFELINSNNIKPIGSNPILYPPMAYRGNIANYSKFVQKVLDTPGVLLAANECFEPTPDRPASNLFKIGMKLEAIDRKNAHLIYPATVGEVNGDEIKVIFDGWKGSFDYTCKYYSREIFPINWCKENCHPILPPKGWELLLQGKIDSIPGLNDSRGSSSQNNSQKLKSSTINTVQIKNENRSNTNSPTTVISSNNIRLAGQGTSNNLNSNNDIQKSGAKIKVKHTPKRKHTPVKHFITTSTSQSQPNPIRFQSTPLNKPLSQPPASILKSSTGFKSIQQSSKESTNHNQSYNNSPVCQPSTQSDNDSDALVIMSNNDDDDDFEDFNDAYDNDIVQETKNHVDLSKFNLLSRAIPYPEWRKSKNDALKATQNENSKKVSSNSKELLSNNNNNNNNNETNESFNSDEYCATLVSAISGAGSNNSVIENAYNNTDSSQTSSVSNQNPSKRLKRAPQLEQSLINSGATVPTTLYGKTNVVDQTSFNNKKTIPSTPCETWSIKEVLNLIQSDTSLAKYSNVFIENEIDGKAFVLLTTDVMINHMGLKLGPVLKINELIEKVKKQSNLIH